MNDQTKRYYIIRTVFQYTMFLLLGILVFFAIISGFRLPGRYVLSQYITTLSKLQRNITIGVVCIATLIVFSTRDAKLWLMDNGTYNESWSQVKDKLTQGVDGSGTFSLFD